ncbi:hypothetical protein CONPUDRAFT_33905, partial [Coniophora puteana RWD-64-598 SS2]
ISSPSNGTSIMPSTPFNFTYNTRADYGTSSYNFTVWLWSSATPSSSGQDFATGYYFGRYAEENYPGECATPDPANPVPPQLWMPDLAQILGGFGTGSTASDVPMYLVVIEEWGTGQGSLGTRFSQTSTQIVYNGTSA